MKEKVLPMSPILFVSCLGFALIQVDVMLVNIILAQIGSDLKTSISSLQWIVNSYVLSFASFLMPSGAFGDQFGSKRIFMGGLAVFGLASFLCSLANSPLHMIVLRSLQGVGAAFILPNSLALLNHFYEEDEPQRIRALGFWNTSGTLMTVISPVIGGALIYLSGWRTAFLINIPFCLVGIWLAYSHIKNWKASSLKGFLDWPGQISGIIFLGCLIFITFAVKKIGTSPWLFVGSIVLAFGAGGVFVFIERSSKSPLLPLELFKNSIFSAVMVMGFLNNLAYYGLIFTLCLYFQRILHYSTLKIGFAFAPIGFTLISNLLGSYIASRKGVRLPILGGFILAFLGYSSLYGLPQSASYSHIVGSFILISLGLGFAIPSMTAALLSTLNPAHSGIGAAAFLTIRQVGSACGVAIFAAMLGKGPFLRTQDIQNIFLICSFLTLAATGIAAFWVQRPKQSIARAF